MGWLDDLIGSLGDAASSGDWAENISVPEVSISELPSYFESGAGLADYIAPAADSISDIISNYSEVPSSAYGDTPAFQTFAETPSYQNTSTSWLDTISSLPETSMYSNETIPEVSTRDIASYLSANRLNPVTSMPSYATDPTYVQSSGPSIMDTLDKYGTMLQSPGGKLLMGLGGAGVSALSAMKQNALLKAAAKKQAEELAARQAAASLYNAPLRLSNPRTAVENPVARRGESAFFTNNRIPSYFAQGGVTGALQSCKCGGGAIGYVKGGSPGQADMIDAKVSDGEYVMDSDVVSALGDGNNEAGAQKLDAMRKAVRTHKRSAPASKIPPKAKSPLEYMKKSKGAK